MKFKFHHMNLCTDGLPKLSAFYRNLFDMGAVGGTGHVRVNDKGPSSAYSGKVDFVTDGAIEFHLSERDLNTGFKMKQYLNPMAKGHFCFRTDDIKGFIRKLDEMGIPYSDYGVWAMADWHQVFLQDPDGNIVEVHQPGAR